MNQKHNQRFPKKILIVDDSLENLRLLASLLTKKGYKVISATDGQMALSIVKGEIPDLILLDVMLPQMDGYEVCRRLKSQEQTRHIPIIFSIDLDSRVVALR